MVAVRDLTFSVKKLKENPKIKEYDELQETIKNQEMTSKILLQIQIL